MLNKICIVSLTDEKILKNKLQGWLETYYQLYP